MLLEAFLFPAHRQGCWAAVAAFSLLLTRLFGPLSGYTALPESPLFRLSALNFQSYKNNCSCYQSVALPPFPICLCFALTGKRSPRSKRVKYWNSLFITAITSQPARSPCRSHGDFKPSSSPSKPPPGSLRRQVGATETDTRTSIFPRKQEGCRNL